MRGRPLTFQTDDIIEKTKKVFAEKGYHATSLDDLLKATDMGSGSFYNTFKGGKKELFRKVLAQRRIAFQQFKTELEKSDNPLELIKNFFRNLASAGLDSHMQGCLVANTVTEMTFLDKELEAEAVSILKDVEKVYTKVIKDAQAQHQIKNQTDPALLGMYLITLWNGINVTSRMYPDPDILSRQIEMQLEILS
ncbi:MAG: TetR family transcriptional regulator C-terminal domain-containing protein [Bacteroidota bacterium]